MSSLSLPSAKPRKTALQRAIELRESGLRLGMPSLSEKDEFWSRIEKRGDDECWSAAQSQFLYEGRMWLKHRLAYRLVHPELAKVPRLHHLGRWSLSCCNPKHYVSYNSAEHNAPDAPVRLHEQETPEWSPPTGYVEVFPGCWVNPKRLGADK